MKAAPYRSRLAAVLEMRRYDPKGKELPLTANVFGNEVGESVKSIKTAWKLTCQRAGITGLHFHDLRREFGCQLLEAGASLHQVRDFLGHMNVTTTNTYLSTTPTHLRDAMRKFEEARQVRTRLAQNGNSTAQTAPPAQSQMEPKSLN